MSIQNKTIVQLHEELVNKTTTATKIVEEVLMMIKTDKKDNFLLAFDETKMKSVAQQIDQQGVDRQNLLAAIPYFAKDNFSTKGLTTTGGSAILKNYIPPFNATVINLLNNQQALMSGKSNLDELGMGGTGTSSAFGTVPNPLNKKHLVGGSSSGSAYGVAKGIVPFALGSDTGDSIRRPASFAGIVGYKPTYGAISRYGMLPYSPSLDHPGVLAKTIEDSAIVADVLVEFDPADFTSLAVEKKGFYQNLNNFDKQLTFGYLTNVHNFLPPNLKKKYDELYALLKKNGVMVKPLEFSQPLLEALSPVYMMISFSEAVSSNANLAGINFGTRVEGDRWEAVMKNTRTTNFGSVVKRRFLIGSLNLQKENQEIYLHKAKKVRRLICEEINQVFQECDLLIIPPSQTVAPLIGNGQEFDDNQNNQTEYIDDILTLGNFSGIPSITIPFVVDHDKMPIGINVNAAACEDLKMFQGAKYLETMIKQLESQVLDHE